MRAVLCALALAAGCAKRPAPVESQPTSGYETPPFYVWGTDDTPWMTHSACAKSYPCDATSDEATVQVLVVVDAAGKPTQVSVLSERPKGQGFGEATRACLLKSTFAPAKDDAGSPVETKRRINVRFVRRPSD